MQFLDHYQPDPKQFVVFRARPGCGGVGDRVIGLLSACVLALVTGRQFRIAWTTPIALRSVWRPACKALPWDRKDWGDPGAHALSLIDQVEVLRGFFRQHDLVQHLPANLLIEANQHFFSDVLRNPSLGAAISGCHLSDAATLSRDLLDALFIPTDDLRHALSPFMRRMAGRRWLGVQVRTLWNWRDGGGRVDEDDLERFCSCARELLDEGQAEAVFATADDATALELVRRRLAPVEVLTVPGEILHHDRSAAGEPIDHRATFVNLHALAACDALIISHWSNFGRLAALWAGQPVWVTRKTRGTAPLEVVGDYRPARLDELLSKESSVMPIHAGGVR